MQISYHLSFASFQTFFNCCSVEAETFVVVLEIKCPLRSRCALNEALVKSPKALFTLPVQGGIIEAICHLTALYKRCEPGMGGHCWLCIITVVEAAGKWLHPRRLDICVKGGDGFGRLNLIVIYWDLCLKTGCVLLSPYLKVCFTFSIVKFRTDRNTLAADVAQQLLTVDSTHNETFMTPKVSVWGNEICFWWSCSCKNYLFTSTSESVQWEILLFMHIFCNKLISGEKTWSQFYLYIQTGFCKVWSPRLSPCFSFCLVAQEKNLFPLFGSDPEFIQTSVLKLIQIHLNQ